jgi:hypothetical protein
LAVKVTLSSITVSPSALVAPLVLAAVPLPKAQLTRRPFLLPSRLLTRLMP